MTVFIDSRAGSVALREPLSRLAPVEVGGPHPGDFHFLGYGPELAPWIIGGEYKRLGDFLQASTDGRLTGTQLPRMRKYYTRMYLLIEGVWRVSAANVLEELVHRDWQPARGRSGAGWRGSEFRKRIANLEERWGLRVAYTSNLQDSARWIADLYENWSQPYESHGSWCAWDQSRTAAPENTLLATSDLPLALRWARELPGVGQSKAAWAALHFKSPRALANAEPADWENVVWKERLRDGSGLREKSFSPATAQRIVEAITTEQTTSDRKRR